MLDTSALSVGHSARQWTASFDVMTSRVSCEAATWSDRVSSNAEIAIDTMQSNEISGASADVPLPEGVPPPSDDQDDLRVGVNNKSPEKWAELALSSVY